MLLNNFRSTGSVRAHVFSQKRKCRFRLFTPARLTNGFTRNVREKSLRAFRFLCRRLDFGKSGDDDRGNFSRLLSRRRENPFWYTFVSQIRARVSQGVHCIARFLKSRRKTNLVLPGGRQKPSRRPVVSSHNRRGHSRTTRKAGTPFRCKNTRSSLLCL